MYQLIQLVWWTRERETTVRRYLTREYGAKAKELEFDWFERFSVLGLSWGEEIGGLGLG